MSEEKQDKAPPLDPPRRFGRWYTKPLLGVVVALGFLVLLEGGIRLVCAVRGMDYRFDPLPQLPQYKVLCQAPGTLKLCPDSGERYDRVRPETFLREAGGKKRIITIGESFVFGLGVKMDQAWPARLSQILGDGVEVLNFGRCGTHTGLLHSIVETALSLKPDMLIMAVGNNEHTMTSFFVGWAGRHPVGVFNLLEFLSHFQIAGLINHAMGNPVHLEVEWDVTQKKFDNPADQRIYAARRRPPNMSWFKGGVAGYEVTRALSEEATLKERVYRRHMQAMIDKADEAGVKVLLATLPIQLYKRPELSGCNVDDPEICTRLSNIVRHLKEDNPTSKEEVIQRALDLDPNSAVVQYEQGVIHLQKGERKEAAAAFHRASGLDLLPDNTPGINNTIRELADDNDLPIADLNALSDEYMTEGRDLFIDRVHMSAKGCDMIAEVVAGEAKKILGISAPTEASKE